MENDLQKIQKKVSKEMGEWQRKKVSEEKQWHEKENRK